MANIIKAKSWERLLWKGKELPVANVQVKHGFYGTHSKVSPGSWEPLSATADILIDPSDPRGFSPYNGTYPHNGDEVQLELHKYRGPSDPGGRVKMKLLVDNIKFTSKGINISLVQRVDGFTRHIHVDPLVEKMNRYYGWLGDKQYQFFGDEGEFRQVTPSYLYHFFCALRAGGYSPVPPTLPTCQLDLPLQWTTWTNQWDNPYYIDDPAYTARLIGCTTKDLAKNIGWLKPKDSQSISSIGFSGTVIRSKATADQWGPSMSNKYGVCYLTNGFVTIGRTQLDDRQYARGAYARTDLFMSFMMTRLGTQRNPEAAYQMRFTTTKGHGLHVVFTGQEQFSIDYVTYADHMPGKAHDSEQRLMTVDLSSKAHLIDETIVTMRTDGRKLYVNIGRLHSGVYDMPGELNSQSDPLISYLSIWLKDYQKVNSWGFAGFQVSGIPNNAEARALFLEHIKDYHLYYPTGRIYYSSKNPNTWESSLASLRDKSAGELLNEMCDALGYSWHITPSGQAIVMASADLPQNGDLDSSVAIKTGMGWAGLIRPGDVGNYSISTELTKSVSSIKFSYSEVAYQYSRKTQLDVYVGGGTMAKTDKKEVFVAPDDHTEWFDVDYTLEDQSSHGYSWLGDRNGSFMGGSYILLRTRNDRQPFYKNGPTTLDVLHAADVKTAVSRLNPYTIKLTTTFNDWRGPTYAGTDGVVTDVLKEEIQLSSSHVDFRKTDEQYHDIAWTMNAPNRWTQDLPVVRARGIMKRTDASVVTHGGSAHAPELQIDGTKWIDSPTEALAISEEIAKRVFDPNPSFGDIEVEYDTKYVLGSVVQVQGMNPNGSSNAFGTILNGVIVAFTHSPASNTTNLTLWIYDFVKVNKTWGELESDNTSGKKTWQAEEETRQRQGVTWTRAEANPTL